MISPRIAWPSEATKRKAPAASQGQAKNREKSHFHHSTVPAYGKQLAEARAQGLTVRTSLIVALSWNLGRAFPRLVVPEELDVAGADFSMVAGLDCIVAHHGEPARALAVAAACMRSGATMAPVLDVSGGPSFYTADVLGILGRAAA